MLNAAFRVCRETTVDEVREAVKSIVVVPTPAPRLGSAAGMVAGAHFFLQDKSGKSIAVEPVDGTLKVHDAPLGVMTNAPPMTDT
jgi:choloylglycine hydrolase